MGGLLLSLFFRFFTSFGMIRSALWLHHQKCRCGNLPPIIEVFTVIG